MDDALGLLFRYGYHVVFVWALVVQIGALVLVDARTVLDVETVPYPIPGAQRVDRRGSEEPLPFALDDGIVFYCSEPNEATSARLVTMARKLGYRDVHPLTGGLAAWRGKGFPLEPMTATGGAPC